MSKAKRFVQVTALTLVAGALTGCSGINASHSVSPASFILPGLIQNDVKPAGEEPAGTPAEQLALLVEPIN